MNKAAIHHVWMEKKADSTALKGHMDIVKFLTLEKYCDPMLQDIHGSVDLHYAVLSGHLEMVKFDPHQGTEMYSRHHWTI